MRLTADVVARVKACKGVYSLSDTARHFGISKSTVSDVWNERRHTAVSPSPEPPNVNSTRVPRAVVVDEAQVLLHRGMKADEVANTIGISRRTLYYHIGTTLVMT